MMNRHQKGCSSESSGQKQFNTSPFYRNDLNDTELGFFSGRKTTWRKRKGQLLSFHGQNNMSYCGRKKVSLTVRMPYYAGKTVCSDENIFNHSFACGFLFASYPGIRILMCASVCTSQFNLAPNRHDLCAMDGRQYFLEFLGFEIGLIIALIYKHVNTFQFAPDIGKSAGSYDSGDHGNKVSLILTLI